MKTQGQRQAEHEQWKEKGVKEQESDRDLQMRGAFDFYVFTLFTSKPRKSRFPAYFLDRSYHSEYFQTVNFPYIITL